MYRPTVRYDDIFRDYVDQVFKITSLDRNQIFRLAMFVAAHSDFFKTVLERYKTKDVPLPLPLWEQTENGFWLELKQEVGEGREDNANAQRTTTVKNAFKIDGSERDQREIQQHRRHEQIEGRDGEISSGEQPITIRSNGDVIRWTFI